MDFRITLISSDTNVKYTSEQMIVATMAKKMQCIDQSVLTLNFRPSLQIFAVTLISVGYLLIRRTKVQNILRSPCLYSGVSYDTRLAMGICSDLAGIVAI